MPMKPACMAIIIPALLWTGQLSAAGMPADPTRPGNMGGLSSNQGLASANAGWVLSSTLVAADRRVAVINGKHVSEGESIDNATVLHIRKLEVLIQSAGKRYTLNLLPDIVNSHPWTMESNL